MRLFLIALVALLGAAPAHAGLTFCNDSALRATVAVGYKGDQDWTSEGWWGVEPGTCATVLEGDLLRTHYYWRATDENGAFAAQDYWFCVTDEAFTIVGDRDCAARGYRRERFSEIVVGTGGSATVRIAAAAAPAAVEARAPDPEPAPAESEYDFDAILAALQGVWHDLEDEAFTTIIKGNAIEDRFVGIVAGEAAFELAATCPKAEGAGPVMIVTYKQFPDEPLCWIILKLDDREWQFVPAGFDAPTRMRKGV